MPFSITLPTFLRPRVAAGLVGVGLAFPALLGAQEALPAPLTRVSEVRELELARLESATLPVRVRGVVTYVASKKDTIKIQDNSGGIGVALPVGATCPKAGDEVEVEGRATLLNVQAHRYPHVAADRLQILGTTAFPVAPLVSVGELASFQHYNQWVSVEGVVVMWKQSRASLSLMLTGPDTWAVVHVRGWDPADFPRDWHGARVRVTGVNMGITHSQADTLIAPTPAQVDVLRPGTNDPFAAPLVTMREIIEHHVPLAERVRVSGVVTAAPDPFTVYLQKGDDALCVRLQHGWLRAGSAGHVYADAGTLPKLAPGDAIEVVGSARRPGGDAREEGCALTSCHVRIVGHEEAALPRPVALSAIAQGAATWQLVQTRGRLLHTASLPLAGGRWRGSLLLEDQGVTLSAVFESKQTTIWEGLNLQDEILLTGVVDPATAHGPRQIRLLAIADAHSLGISPAVRQQRLWWWTGGVTALALLGGVWIATLHRSLRRQKAAEAIAQELNQKLEKRVAERTSELEQTQAELRRALDQERELGELKSRFVTLVSHEFRTPLGIIMSAIELMRHYEDQLPSEQKRELQEDIHSATRLMAGLMEQVLVLGRVEAGKLGCRPVPTDLSRLVEKFIEESAAATDHRCPIQWQPEGDLTGACADENLLRHLLSNLLTNAVKYSPPGSPVVLRARREEGDAVIEIIDHGIGIPEEDRARLFEAFHRCGNVGEIPGTGLGLVIVKRCVELHGGSLSLDSTVGAGTTFSVRLPLFG